MNECEYRKIVESRRVPEKGRIRASIENVSRGVSEKGRIRECRKMVESVRVSKTVPTSTKKWTNQCEHRKMVESGRVPGKGRIRTSIEKTASTNTEKRSNECEYRKIVESRRVSGKARIRACIQKMSRRVSKKGLITVSTGK